MSLSVVHCSGCVALVLSCDLRAHHNDLGWLAAPHAALKICASDLQHKRGRQLFGA